MATLATTIRFNNGTNALIKAWGSAINAGLAAAGLVQTADTGQINWSTTTVTATTSSQTYGYEIWRFSDTLQATAPVFMRVVYGSTGAGSGYCSINISVGTGTDGAGSLTGLISTIRGGNNDVSPSFFGVLQGMNWGQPCWFFGDGSSFAMALTPNVNQNPNASPSVFVWMVERTRNADNTPNADGIVYVCSLSSRPDAIYYSRYNFISRLTNSVVGSNNFIPIPYTSNDYAGSVDGSQFYAYPLLVHMPKTEAPSPTLLGYQNGLANWTTVSLVVNGASHTYLVLPGVLTAMPGTVGTENNGGQKEWCSLLMRYE